MKCDNCNCEYDGKMLTIVDPSAAQPTEETNVNLCPRCYSVIVEELIQRTGLRASKKFPITRSIKIGGEGDVSSSIRLQNGVELSRCRIPGDIGIKTDRYSIATAIALSAVGEPMPQPVGLNVSDIIDVFEFDPESGPYINYYSGILHAGCELLLEQESQRPYYTDNEGCRHFMTPATTDIQLINTIIKETITCTITCQKNISEKLVISLLVDGPNHHERGYIVSIAATTTYALNRCLLGNTLRMFSSIIIADAMFHTHPSNKLIIYKL